MSNSQLQAVAFSQQYLNTIGTLTAPSGDFLTCPVGLLMLLNTLLGSGAPGGSTRTQISRTLGFPDTTKELQSFALSTTFYKTISQSLEKEVTENEDETIKNVQVADALVLQRGYALRKRFVENLSNNFDATLFEVDFTNPANAIKPINQWANEKSNGLIPQLFTSPRNIDPDTRMMLMNLFVFKDNWMATFEKTEMDSFFTAPDSSKQITMMSVSERMPVVQDQDAGFTAIKKPMRNPRFSFIIVLPNVNFNMKAVNRVLFQTKSVKALFDVSMEYEVQLTMPKFTLDGKSNLIPTVRRMGIIDLFDDKRANLSGITISEAPYVNVLEQASVLRVDEYGVEAAAATYMAIVPMSAVQTIRFKVDQPFGCMIYDERLDLPLFVARIFNPKQ